jgi:hypothetical protein
MACIQYENCCISRLSWCRLVWHRLGSKKKHWIPSCRSKTLLSWAYQISTASALTKSSFPASRAAREGKTGGSWCCNFWQLEHGCPSIIACPEISQPTQMHDSTPPRPAPHLTQPNTHPHAAIHSLPTFILNHPSIPSQPLHHASCPCVPATSSHPSCPNMNVVCRLPRPRRDPRHSVTQRDTAYKITATRP